MSGTCFECGSWLELCSCEFHKKKDADDRLAIHQLESKRFMRNSSDSDRTYMSFLLSDMEEDDENEEDDPGMEYDIETDSYYVEK